jgi:solute carrier family 1 (high affinity glutamate transporter) protein 2
MLREVELQPASADDDRDDATLLPSPSLVVARPSRGDGARRGRVLAAVLAKEPLLLWTVVGVALGVAAGLVARAADPTPRAIELIGFPGELFMRALRALVIPLVSVSMVAGVTSLARRSQRGAKRVAARLLGAYAVTTLVAVAIGLAVVHIIRPGVGVSLDACQNPAAPASASASASASAPAPASSRDALDSILNVARSSVPANIPAAAADGNVLGVISASLAFGAALAAVASDPSTRDAVEPAAKLVDACNAIVERATAWAVAATPLGVFSLVAARVASSCDPAGTLAALGKYVAAVLTGLALHGGIALPAMHASAVSRARARRAANVDVDGDGTGAGKSPIATASDVLRAGAPAMIAAFATDSSSAALPTTRRCARDAGTSASVADFALPLGATVNMNGTALYESLTVLFIAQLHGVRLSFGATVVVALTSAVAAVGAAAIPSAGLVTMLAVLDAAGLGEYAADVGTLLALDWFLDRCRTAVNVEGDLIVAAAVAAWEMDDEGGTEGAGQGGEGG